MYTYEVPENPNMTIVNFQTSGPTIKEEAQSPSAAIINKSYKQGTSNLAPPARRVTVCSIFTQFSWHIVST